MITQPVTMTKINLELGRPANQSLSLGDPDVRVLADKPSGSIAYSDLVGKSWVTINRNITSFSVFNTTVTAAYASMKIENGKLTRIQGTGNGNDTVTIVEDNFSRVAYGIEHGSGRQPDGLTDVIKPLSTPTTLSISSTVTDNNNTIWEGILTLYVNGNVAHRINLSINVNATGGGGIPDGSETDK